MSARMLCVTSCRRRQVISFHHISTIFPIGCCSAAWRPPPWRPRTAESECGFSQWRRGTVRSCTQTWINTPLALSKLIVWIVTARSTYCFICSEMNGSCVGNVQLCGSVSVQSEGVFLHRFQRSCVASQQVLGKSGLASGDRIVVSDQEGRLVGLATGYLCEVSRSSISCTLDRWEQVRVKYLKDE